MKTAKRKSELQEAPSVRCLSPYWLTCTGWDTLVDTHWLTCTAADSRRVTSEQRWCGGRVLQRGGRRQRSERREEEEERELHHPSHTDWRRRCPESLLPHCCHGAENQTHHYNVPESCGVLFVLSSPASIPHVTCSSMYLWSVSWRAGPTSGRSSWWQRGGSRVSSEHGWFRLSWPDRSDTSWFITKPKLSAGGGERWKTLYSNCSYWKNIILTEKYRRIKEFMDTSWRRQKEKHN